MKNLLIAVSAMSILVACTNAPVATNPEIVEKLKMIQPDMPLNDAEAILGEAVSFTIAPDKKSHCKAYLYHNDGSDADQYVIVQYVQNKVFKVNSDQGSTQCTPTTAPKDEDQVIQAKPIA